LRRMIRRSWVMRAVPAAAITSAPAMAARNKATARDSWRCAPRKLMFTACAFWIMKISTAVRARTPTISQVRMPLIRVESRSRFGAVTSGLAGAEPLAEGGGRVPVAGDSVMTLLPSGSWDWADENNRRSLVTPGGWPWMRLIIGSCCSIYT
jgi:hypothetical protein